MNETRVFADGYRGVFQKRNCTGLVWRDCFMMMAAGL